MAGGFLSVMATGEWMSCPVIYMIKYVYSVK